MCSLRGSDGGECVRGGRSSAAAEECDRDVETTPGGDGEKLSAFTALGHKSASWQRDVKAEGGRCVTNAAPLARFVKPPAVTECQRRLMQVSRD